MKDRKFLFPCGVSCCFLEFSYADLTDIVESGFVDDSAANKLSSLSVVKL